MLFSFSLQFTSNFLNCVCINNMYVTSNNIFNFLCKKYQSYIVYLGSHDHGEGVNNADFERVTDTHHEFLQSYLGRYTLTLFECTSETWLAIWYLWINVVIMQFGESERFNDIFIHKEHQWLRCKPRRIWGCWHCRWGYSKNIVFRLIWINKVPN